MTTPLVRSDIMRASIRIAFCVAALLPARVALADDGDIRVDVVVDMTDAGRKIPRPTPDHPAYYYPVTRGYTQGGAILNSEKAPPPTLAVQRLFAKALAEQGYLVAIKHPPSLVLIFWWGYKAPEFAGPSADMSPSAISGGQTSGANAARQGYGAINQLSESGGLSSTISANHNEMEELVLGTTFDPDPMENPIYRSPRTEELMNAAGVARYYVMVGAMSFSSAAEKKPVLMWTARVSTELQDHTLEQVLPTLISTAAPMFGQDSKGPQITKDPIVPMGNVIVGTPVLKTDKPASAAP
jgi:hypothetical protein